MIGGWEFEIDFVKAATVGDTGSFDVALALLDHRDTPLARVPGVSFEMDVQLGSTNTDRGTKFPQATIGGAVMSVPEPSTLALVGAAMVSLCFAHRALKRWRAA